MQLQGVSSDVGASVPARESFSVVSLHCQLSEFSQVTSISREHYSDILNVIVSRSYIISNEFWEGVSNEVSFQFAAFCHL
jgi:hypothetical protein